MKIRICPLLALSLLLPLLAGCAETLFVGAATGLAVAQDRRSTGAVVDDNVIEFNAGAELRADKELDEQTHVNITSYNGIVLLTGEAPTIELRDRVLAAVRRVPNIRRITNEIRIAPLASFGIRSQDAWITTQVKARLATNEGVNLLHVKVGTDNAVVYLMGLVKRAEAELAADLASRVKNVARVVKLFEYVD
jgi:osmotically-inducible protein OsmY